MYAQAAEVDQEADLVQDACGAGDSRGHQTVCRGKPLSCRNQDTQINSTTLLLAPLCVPIIRSSYVNSLICYCLSRAKMSDIDFAKVNTALGSHSFERITKLLK